MDRDLRDRLQAQHCGPLAWEPPAELDVGEKHQRHRADGFSLIVWGAHNGPGPRARGRALDFVEALDVATRLDRIYTYEPNRGGEAQNCRDWVLSIIRALPHAMDQAVAAAEQRRAKLSELRAVAHALTVQMPSDDDDVQSKDLGIPF